MRAAPLAACAFVPALEDAEVVSNARGASCRVYWRVVQSVLVVSEWVAHHPAPSLLPASDRLRASYACSAARYVAHAARASWHPLHQSEQQFCAWSRQSPTFRHASTTPRAASSSARRDGAALRSATMPAALAFSVSSVSPGAPFSMVARK